LQRDTAVLVWLQGNGLVVDEASVLAGVLVGQIEGIARELEAAMLFRLDEVGIISSCVPSLAFCGERMRVESDIRTISQMRSPEMLDRSDIVAAAETDLELLRRLESRTFGYCALSVCIERLAGDWSVRGMKQFLD
jgi:hypothetical protein